MSYDLWNARRRAKAIKVEDLPPRATVGLADVDWFGLVRDGACARVNRDAQA